jgi:hypothetical protein
MKRATAVFALFAIVCVGQLATAAEPTKLDFEIYSGYFVSNKFEPGAANSFVVATTQEQFDTVFGVAFVMKDKSHRLPANAFKSLMVIAPIKRGKATWEFKVENVTVRNGVVELKYTATSQPSNSATYAVPFVVSIPKGEYNAVQFVENGKPKKKVVIRKP